MRSIILAALLASACTQAMALGSVKEMIRGGMSSSAQEGSRATSERGANKGAAASPRAAGVKDQVKGTLSSPAIFAPNPRGLCPYLTKPLVRPDGGGLNRHAEGAMYCHLGRAMKCDSGRWIDRGKCDMHGALTQAYMIEGSDPPGVGPAGGQGAASGGSSASNPSGQGPDGDTPGEGDGSDDDPGEGPPGGLMGMSPSGQQLRAMQQAEEDQMRRAQAAGRSASGDPSSSSQAGGAGGASGTDPAAECAAGRQLLAQTNQAIAQFQPAINAGYVSRSDSGYQQLVATRDAIVRKLQSLGCP